MGFKKAFFLSSTCSKTHYIYRKPLEYPVGKSTLSNPHRLCNGFLTWITWHLKQLQKIVEFQWLKREMKSIHLKLGKEVEKVTKEIIITNFSDGLRVT